MSQDEKPAVLQDSEFTIQEGFLYRACRTGAIWMNKLFFGALVLLGVWLLMGAFGAVDAACVDSIEVTETPNGTMDQPGTKCSVFLSPTAMYLGAMTLISFALSIGLGLLGLVVGKNIIQVTRTQDEVGAGPQEGAADEEQKDDGTG